MYSGRTLLLCMTSVLIIMTFKHFWLLQSIGHQTRVTYLSYTVTHIQWFQWLQLAICMYVCDNPSLLSYALEQPEMLKSHDYKSELPLDTFILKVYFSRPLPVLTQQKYPQNLINVL